MDAKEAFIVARRYLTGDPITADYSSVQPVMILPSSGDWIVVCEYKRVTGNQKERSAVFVDGQGQIKGFGNI